MQVNDLIFKELIKRGYSLEGKTRVWNIADSKLWYLTPEQAQGYLELDADKEYKKHTEQKQGEDLIKVHIKEILEVIGNEPINVVDIGCGNGEKAAIIIEELKKNNPLLKLRYCPIDISGYMVSKAIESFSKLKFGEIVEFKWNISDFENLENVTPLLRKNEFKRNLILFLGSTLGNFEVNDILYSIRTAMERGDLLLIDTAINDGKQEERVNSHVNNKKFNDWLIHIPLLLGLEKEDVEFGGRFKNSRLEFFYTVKKDKEVKFQNKRIYFNNGDQIVILIAYKHEKDNLLTYLNLHFDDVKLKISKDQSKVLAFCKR